MAMIINAILLAMVLFLAVKGVMSHYQEPNTGLKNGMLQPCPDKPNCVCSESLITENRDPRHNIEPLKLTAEADASWARLEQLINDMGGTVIHNDDAYMHAEFSSMIFRFVDDVEARLDRDQGVIHLRSASRVGHSDFNANRKRMEILQQRWLQ
jgi:uncharacterized protein (DUF1499 family)